MYLLSISKPKSIDLSATSSDFLEPPRPTPPIRPVRKEEHPPYANVYGSTYRDMSSSSSKPKKIGGEYGEIRANIDVDKLNTYLARHVKVVKTPVTVKQFKVCEETEHEEHHVLTYLCSLDR